MTTPRPEDKRVVRTKERLTEALFQLISEQRWDKIRVQDLLDRTGTSRSAFYAHYENKYDLLTSAIPNFLVSITGPDNKTLDSFPLFSHALEVAPILRPLFSQPILSDITATFQRGLVEAWTEFGLATESEAGWLKSEFLAGALVASVKAYVIDRHPEPPEVVARRFDQYANGVLKLI